MLNASLCKTMQKKLQNWKLWQCGGRIGAVDHSLRKRLLRKLNGWTREAKERKSKSGECKHVMHRWHFLLSMLVLSGRGSWGKTWFTSLQGEGYWQTMPGKLVGLIPYLFHSKGHLWPDDIIKMAPTTKRARTWKQKEDSQSNASKRDIFSSASPRWHSESPQMGRKCAYL